MESVNQAKEPQLYPQLEPSKDTKDPLKYWSLDDILAQVGDYGMFQKLLTCVMFLMCIPMTYPIIIMYFSSFEPSWRCRTNSSVCNFTGEHEAVDDYANTLRCAMNRSEWEYTKPDTYSFVTQFHAYCPQGKWKVDLTRSVSFFGWGVGAIVMGWLGDKYGRKKLLLPSLIATLLVTLITPFLPNLYLIVFVRFFACFFIPGSTLTAFILITEVVGERWKVFAGTVIYITVPLGMCLILPKYYFIEGWRNLGVACSAPYAVLLVFYPLLPESLQWLCEQGRTDEVMVILARIARWNKTQLPSNVTIRVQEQSNESDNDTGSSTSFVDIFRGRALAIGSFINAYLYLVIGLSYWAIVMAANDLGWTLWGNFLVMNLADILSSFVSIFLCNTIGRRKGSLLPTFAGGFFCVVVGFLPKGGAVGVVRITCALIGKFMLGVSYNSIYVWTIQLYPIIIRAKGMGWAQVNNRIGCTLAPWISDWTMPLGSGAPFITLGVPVIIAVFMAIKLPEFQLVRPKVVVDKATA